MPLRMSTWFDNHLRHGSIQRRCQWLSNAEMLLQIIMMTADSTLLLISLSYEVPLMRRLEWRWDLFRWNMSA